MFKSSTVKCIFDCPYCQKEYTSQLNCISSGGTWCTCLKNKTENKLFDFLLTLGFQIDKQKKFQWCKNKQELPFDFCIDEYKLLIELDGIQHFEQVSKWKNPTITHERDIYKMECANNQGYSIIRIFQKDVWKDKNNWKIKLIEAIQNYTVPTNIYIGDIYKKVCFICENDVVSVEDYEFFIEYKQKCTDEEIDIIINIILKYQTFPLKTIKNKLRLQYDIHIDEPLIEEVKEILLS